MKEGYDPKYGFFNATSQQLLYPNPDIPLIQPDYLKHFHFLGRMLGKVRKNILLLITGKNMKMLILTL